VISIIHSRIHARLTEKTRGNILTYGFIVECISRMLNFKGGLPKCDIYIIITELVELNLLKKINRRKFQLLKNQDKRLRSDAY